jgi:hypothetical protein
MAVWLSVAMTMTSVSASTCNLFCCSARFDWHCTAVRLSAKAKTDAAASHHCGTMLGDRGARDSAMRSIPASRAMAASEDPVLPAIARPELEPVTAVLHCHRACGKASALALASRSIQLSPFGFSLSGESVALLVRPFREQHYPLSTLLESARAPLSLRI